MICPDSSNGAASVARVGYDGDTTSDDFRYLHIGLPPHIARLKAAGSLKTAIEACNRALEDAPVSELAACLRAERYRMQELSNEYCIPRERAVQMLKDECPGFTEADFDRLIASGRIDWRMVEGVPCVLDTFIDSLRIYAHEVPGMDSEPPADRRYREEVLAQMHELGSSERIVTLKAAIEVPGATNGETVEAWLPAPRSCASQSDIEILASTAGVVAGPLDAPARTVYWESRECNSFEVTYRYRAHAVYSDVYGGELRRDSGLDPAPCSADLAEDAPHILFTPYLKALADEIVRDYATSLDRARAIYDYVTKNVDYRYQPAYAQLDSIANECALSLRGDCGVMALLFITLCRIAGVPARWQSGLYTEPGRVGCHDWAQFYIEGAGWLYADCSFGSSARREGAEERRRHYFGNLDPWRMVANSQFQAELCPPDMSVRHDPYDNQMGEANVDGRGCREREMRRTVELVDAQDVTVSS